MKPWSSSRRRPASGRALVTPRSRAAAALDPPARAGHAAITGRSAEHKMSRRPGRSFASGSIVQLHVQAGGGCKAWNVLLHQMAGSAGQHRTRSLNGLDQGTGLVRRAWSRSSVDREQIRNIDPRRRNPRHLRVCRQSSQARTRLKLPVKAACRGEYTSSQAPPFRHPDLVSPCTLSGGTCRLVE